MVIRFSPDPDPMAAILQEVAQSGLYSRGRVMVAFASEAGVKRFYNALGVDLCASTDIIVGMSMSTTSPESIRDLHTVCSRVFVAHTVRTFHPKMYLFDDGDSDGLPANARVIIGSSNLEDTGLQYNFEINVDHVLNPTINEAHSETWNSAIDVWNQMLNDELRIHQIGATPESLVQDIQYWIDEGVLTPGGSPPSSSSSLKSRGSYRAGSSITSATNLTPASTIQNTMSIPDHGISFGAEDDVDPEPESETELESAPESEPEQEDGEAIRSLPQYYVRQLSTGERQRLSGAYRHGGGRGAYEFSVTVTALELHFDFWGWPNEFHDVEDATVQRERSVILTLNYDAGVEATLTATIWYRVASSRTFIVTYQSPSAAGVVLPTDEQLQNCLVVFSISEQEGIDFDWRIVLQTDADYQEFLRYCVHTTVHARWGYSPVSTNPAGAEE